jgi:hypothetical protein
MNLFLNPHLIKGFVWLGLILASEGTACFLIPQRHLLAAKPAPDGLAALSGLDRCTPTNPGFRVGAKHASPSPVPRMVPA